MTSLESRRMRQPSFFVVLPVVLLVPLTLACGPGDEAGDHMSGMQGGEASSRAAGSSIAGDTAELRELYDSIDMDHDRLMTRFGEFRDRMPDEARELYRTMEAMHGTTGEIHGTMMSEMHGGGMMAEGMMGGGMDPAGMSRAREWDWQMETMHRQMSAWMGEQGFEDMAAIHQRMAGYYERAHRSLSEDLEGTDSIAAPEGDEGEVQGQVVFQRSCASCHGPDGEGRAGIFPPLAGSSWVSGESRTAVRIVLHGLEGPIEVAGRSYDGVMPAFRARLSDREIAAVLTHVRTSFTDASPIDAEEVGSVRREQRGRTDSWTASELR